MNNVQLIGRLTRDIDLKKTPQGDSVGRFTLAVDRKFKNKNGEYDADFINCQIWRQAADTLARYAHKGTKIAVDGNIRTGSYENQQGQKVYTTEVVVNNFYFVESRQQQQEQTPVQQDSPFNGFAGSNVEFDESDLPF